MVGPRPPKPLAKRVVGSLDQKEEEKKKRTAMGARWVTINVPERYRRSCSPPSSSPCLTPSPGARHPPPLSTCSFANHQPCSSDLS